MSAKEQALRDIKVELDLGHQSDKVFRDKHSTDPYKNIDSWKLRISHLINHKKYFKPVGNLVLE